MNIDFWPKNPKANLEMNVSSVIKMSYEQKTMKYDNKNKPKTKPIQTQSNPIKPNLTRLRWAGGEREFLFRLEAFDIIAGVFGAGLFQIHITYVGQRTKPGKHVGKFFLFILCIFRDKRGSKFSYLFNKPHKCGWNASFLVSLFVFFRDYLLKFINIHFCRIIRAYRGRKNTLTINTKQEETSRYTLFSNLKVNLKALFYRKHFWPEQLLHHKPSQLAC